MTVTAPPTPDSAPAPRNPIARHPWLAALGTLLLAVLVLVLVLLWDWNWFKGPIERRVSAQTGREFRIEGNLDVDLGSTATISAGGAAAGQRQLGTREADGAGG